MEWFYFSVSRIFDDGSLDLHLHSIDGLPANEDIREIVRPVLYDLPDGNIWHGYVQAVDGEAAYNVIAAKI